MAKFWCFSNMIGGLVKLLMVITCSSVSDASYFEKKLLKELFIDYKKDMRPVLNDNDTVMVAIGLSLSQIIDVDEKNQIMTTSVWTRQEWFNPYLRWNKTDYGNITSINVISSNLWVPDLVLYNNADESIDFRGNLDKLSTRVQVFYDGKNKWLAPVMLRSKCKINVKYFPFDSQNCSLKFGSWTYDGYRLDVQNESSNVDLMKYSKSGEWHLESAPATRNVGRYFCCPEPYPDVTFHFIIKRRSLFYLTNFILPLVIISALIIFVFTLPPQSGERISLSITLLLSMTVFMLVITDKIPDTSEVVPLIAKFYTAVMVEMALALMITCYVLRCYHTSTREVPRWMKKYVIEKLANFFGIKKSEALLKQEREEKSSWKPGDEESLLKRIINKGTKQIEDVEKGMVSNQGLSTDENGASFLSKWGKTQDSIGGKMLGSLEIISGNVQAKEKEEMVREQWLVIATVMDRVAMWAFAVVIVATMITIFQQCPGYVS